MILILCQVYKASNVVLGLHADECEISYIHFWTLFLSAKSLESNLTIKIYKQAINILLPGVIINCKRVILLAS